MASLAGLQKRYDRCIKSDDYYGAEQACRMMHHRLTQNKSATPSDLDTARGILHTGAVTLLQKNQVQAGTALALLFVKHLEDYKAEVTEANVSELKQIVESYASEGEDETSDKELKREKLRFLKSAVAWSARRDCAGYKNGHEGLNGVAAIAAAEVGDVELAHKLFVYSDAPDEFAVFLHEWGKQVLESEKGLLLTRAVLRLLALENVGDATAVRMRFAELEGWREAPPLGNFCELVIKICRLEGAGALYEKLLNTYQAELKRDERLKGLCENIGRLYFGIQPPAPGGLGGVMNSMLRGLMNQ